MALPAPRPPMRLECRFDRGPAARLAVGLIALENDMVIEPELRTFLRLADVEIYTNRIPMAPAGTLEALSAMADEVPRVARGLLPLDRPKVIAFGCTSGAMVIGSDRIASLIRAVHPQAAVVTPIAAAMGALNVLGTQRIALLTPYIDEVHQAMAASFVQSGFTVVSQATFGLATEGEVRRVAPDSIIDAAKKLAEGSDAVFIACTALRCSSVIGALERLTGRPVVTSNQAIAWQCLRFGGLADVSPGMGRLFEH